ncbi:MAG: signal peptidase I [Defluviitaleaceae bacterium]|nr:signal peptidase I [Defluviitaleaceae bacterium]MCL2837384.1 signal peptidase I [Defluviitaleaceae bacterium]
MYIAFWPVKYDGIGMNPGINTGDRVFISRAAASLGLLNRGNIVICAFEDGNGSWSDTVMRIIGVPGDYIAIHDGAVFINFEELPEKYLPADMKTYPDMPPLLLEDSKYFVLGDNRPVSGDSRVFGTVDKRHISAKALFRFYPFGAIRFL